MTHSGLNGHAETPTLKSVDLTDAAWVEVGLWQFNLGGGSVRPPSPYNLLPKQTLLLSVRSFYSVVLNDDVWEDMTCSDLSFQSQSCCGELEESTIPAGLCDMYVFV